MKAWSILAKIALDNVIAPRHSGCLNCEFRDAGMGWNSGRGADAKLLRIHTDC